MVDVRFVLTPSGRDAVARLCAVHGVGWPALTYVVLPELPGGSYTAVDNSDHQAWTEEFKTLDGALLWAMKVKEDADEVRRKLDFIGMICAAVESPDEGGPAPRVSADSDT